MTLGDLPRNDLAAAFRLLDEKAGRGGIERELVGMLAMMQDASADGDAVWEYVEERGYELTGPEAI